MKKYLDEKAMYSQLDKRWSRETLGNTIYTIGKYGCTITATCKMLYEMLGVNITPVDAAKNFKFDHIGRLYWESIEMYMKELGYKVKCTKRAEGKPSHNLRTEYATDPSKGMLIELYQPQYQWPYHWVWLKNNTVLRLPWVTVFDPIPGKIVKKFNWNISGYALFEVPEPE